uniref:Heat shock protein 90 n=1 Tax=Meloidogyne javanica TaxID=6303 RepID=A0A915LKY4_MELJA
VFIRELIANASDALEKRRYLEMGDKASPVQEIPFEIRIDCDVKNRKLVFTDTGIGMNEEELVGLLGTIAKSGSKSFRSDEEKAESLIGQFGVGFYSAFVVSDKVRVTTRKVDETTGHVWTWSGGKQFEVEEDSTTQVGTKIELWLKDSEAAKFVHAEKVADVINKYSYFISVPIFLNGERINVMSALWMMKPSETTQEMHDTLFK